MATDLSPKLVPNILIPIPLRPLKEPIAVLETQNTYAWTLEESEKYISYLKQNFKDFQSPESRKEKKVFLAMSESLVSRSNSQVKSHHQKMIKRHHSIQKIIEYYQAKIAKIKAKMAEGLKEKGRKRLYKKKRKSEEKGNEQNPQSHIQDQHQSSAQKSQTMQPEDQSRRQQAISSIWHPLDKILPYVFQKWS